MYSNSRNLSHLAAAREERGGRGLFETFRHNPPRDPGGRKIFFIFSAATH
jgi:hypothetical protein